MKLTYTSKQEQRSIESALKAMSPEIAHIFGGRATFTMGDERQRFVKQIEYSNLLPQDYDCHIDSNESEIVLRLQSYEEPQHD